MFRECERAEIIPWSCMWIALNFLGAHDLQNIDLCLWVSYICTSTIFNITIENTFCQLCDSPSLPWIHFCRARSRSPTDAIFHLDPIDLINCGKPMTLNPVREIFCQTCCKKANNMCSRRLPELVFALLIPGRGETIALVISGVPKCSLSCMRTG